jgi:hypothetical protein
MGRLMGSGRKKNATFDNTENGPKRERKTSGGLLGAALQLHSQGSRNSSRGSDQRNQSVASEQVRIICDFFLGSEKDQSLNYFRFDSSPSSPRTLQCHHRDECHQACHKIHPRVSETGKATKRICRGNALKRDA